ncbi:hypothetical protein GOP47_0003645 [Adiantum capillus-veneris]|uniref:CBM20 domain-containing protein n=1 Tax=Adiantum capillus-veneris TaxID=13818 RepID=A0A9D4V6P7_ADICA|nr:hypothetical protein GOP47_0003645 [Adiantum capillus-veneris]
MQGLSAFRIAHCSFRCSPAAKQDLVLLGFQQTSGSLKCSRKGFSTSVPILKAILQDGSATENLQIPLGGEVRSNQAEEEVKNDCVALEEGPTIEVKFVLEKKCHFGERFNVVGNDPIFGSWDVKAAIPMEWADGDIWTAEVNVPAEKEFEFKFVLTGEGGEVVWQPGSNRVFKTVGGISLLVVNEEWGSVGETTATKVQLFPTDPVNETSTTTEAEGTLVPGDISGAEDAAKDEIVMALESTEDGTEANSTPTAESDLNAAPEVPMAELDIATTVVKSVVVVDGTV